MKYANDPLTHSYAALLFTTELVSTVISNSFRIVVSFYTLMVSFEKTLQI